MGGPFIGSANSQEIVSAPQTAASADLAAKNQPMIVGKPEAFIGRPYGIGRVKFRLRPGDEMIQRVGATLLTEADNRILYPVINRSAFVELFGQLANGNGGSDTGQARTAWFLFKGDQPLQLKLQGSDGIAFQVQVNPVKRERQFNRFAKEWWQNFNRSIRMQIENNDYTPMVETYLQSLISKRMGLPISEPYRGERDPLIKTFELMFDVETLRNDTIRKLMQSGVREEAADQPVPPNIEWTSVEVDESILNNIDIEPIAKCVPKECFYLRFGSWENQLWLQRLLEEFGGDLSRMIRIRGFKHRVQSKFLNQLAIRSTKLDQYFGGAWINDVAVIGTDTYFASGSAVGVLLHAKNSKKLEKNLRAKRRQFARENTKIGVTIEEVPVLNGSATIEFLSTPDNRYRSYYAISGDCHLMTTSKVIAERFLESGRGIGSLGESPEYLYARYKMPLAREDTVFVYLPTGFFQQLLTPQYQIELRRRNRIVTDMNLLELANLAAKSEGQLDLDTPELVAKGYLPQGFGYRPDGGRYTKENGRLSDSIRGQRGFFKPILDTPLLTVTQDESDWYTERSTFFTQAIPSLDPMFAAIKRTKYKNNIERVVFDSKLALFGGEKYGWLMSMLGPPLTKEVASGPDDIVRLQASMRGRDGRKSPLIYQVFAAVQDQVDLSVSLQPVSTVKMLQALREVPGYLGAWPSPGLTDWMPALGRDPDEFGYTYSRILKLWKLQWQGISVLSFDQQRLESLKSSLTIIDKPNNKPIDEPMKSQIRLVVGDLANSKLRGWANSLNYRRSWQTSVANVRLFNLLEQQFRIPPESARTIVERMLDVELVCSLRGNYQLVTLPSGRKIWHSDAWPSFTRPELPEGHTAPFLKWFRGLELNVSKGQTFFMVQGFLDIERMPAKSPLPAFDDVFKGFGNLLGGGEKSVDSEKK